MTFFENVCQMSQCTHRGKVLSEFDVKSAGYFKSKQNCKVSVVTGFYLFLISSTSGTSSDVFEKDSSFNNGTS